MSATKFTEINKKPIQDDKMQHGVQIVSQSHAAGSVLRVATLLWPPSALSSFMLANPS